MNALKILFVEDEPIPQNAFKEDVAVFKNQPDNSDVESVIVDNVKDAVKVLNVLYDGAIIDLRLGDNDEGGKEIIQILYDEFTKIPVIVVTGLPDLVVDHPSIIKRRSRDVGSYRDDLLLFQQIRDIGLAHIIKRKGRIEETLRDVFLVNLLPQIDTWISYGETYKEKDPKRTERALLRYTLNHLYQHFEEADELFFPEEVYLYPPATDKITTGSMIKKHDQWFVVLSPACDLVPRGENNKIKTDHILLAKVERIDRVLGEQKSKSKVSELCSNKRTYYHWLPKTSFFDGGILDYRQLITCHKDNFEGKFGNPIIQISPSFVKDIVSRFSSYYARQGQPDIDSKDFIDQYTS